MNILQNTKKNQKDTVSIVTTTAMNISTLKLVDHEKYNSFQG